MLCTMNVERNGTGCRPFGHPSFCKYGQYSLFFFGQCNIYRREDDQGRITRYALVGGADALTRFTLNGFNTLMILDKEYCKPFDENRHGLNLGEGAAYLVLASEKGLKYLNKKPYARISGYAMPMMLFIKRLLRRKAPGPSWR